MMIACEEKYNKITLVAEGVCKTVINVKGPFYSINHQLIYSALQMNDHFLSMSFYLNVMRGNIIKAKWTILLL